ncbi:transglycosylase domain-containing protein [Arthrobacter sp. NPDC055138]
MDETVAASEDDDANQEERTAAAGQAPAPPDREPAPLRSTRKPWWRRRKDTVCLDEMLAPVPPARRHGPALRFAAWAGAVAVVALSAGSLVAPGAIAFSAATDSVLDLWEELPGELPLDTALPQHTVLLDRDGKEFARFYSENRIDVALDHVSETFRDTLLSTEDSRFYEHHGVDPMGVTRAMVTNSVGGERQGGSTITQQLVQNILVNNARDETEQSVAVGETYNAKIREAKYAVQLENRLDKDQILNMYVNAVYFGHRAYGVQAAARIYFNTTADKLNLPQSALLVGLLKGPVYYDPMTYPDRALARRNTVLNVMEGRGSITPDEAAAARQSGLGLDPGSMPSGCADSDYPFYCDLVRDEILSDPAFGKTQEERADRLSRGGMTLTTAMDRKAMAAAQKAVSKAMGNKNRVALGTAVVEPGTGHIAAVVQNRAWGEGKGKTEVVFADSPFQVGSAMKPIVLATALSQGISPRTKLLANGPYYSRLDNPPGGFHNYGNKNYGNIDAYQAVRASVNVYFIRLIERTGVKEVAELAEKLGITTIPTKKLHGKEASLALGAYEISPLQMANAYSTFVSGGVLCRPVTITEGIRSDTGEKIPVPEAGCHQAINPSVAATVADALKEPFNPAGTLGVLGMPKGRKAGAKTGTTNDFAANWIVGVTPQYATAVWLGDPRGGAQHPLTTVKAYGKTFRDLTGSELAGPVWKDTMEGLHKGLPAEPMPEADPLTSSVAASRSMPDLRGLGVNEAITVLLRNNLVPVIAQKTTKPDPRIGKNVVTKQSAPPGSSLAFRQEVKITLSAGSNTAITVPGQP